VVANREPCKLFASTSRSAVMRPEPVCEDTVSDFVTMKREVSPDSHANAITSLTGPLRGYDLVFLQAIS
jgi:hypothetical protein